MQPTQEYRHLDNQMIRLDVMIVNSGIIHPHYFAYIHVYSNLYVSLWATSGQSALESSRVLVISASATSTSILKNLVLPGIGHFTILDSEITSQEDVGNNFFLEGPDSIGKPRAREAVRLLRELNESVEGIADTNVCISMTVTNIST